MVRPEQVIHRTVIAHLRSRPVAGIFAFHVPNGGKRRPVEAAIMKGLGVTAGVPDIIAIKDGQCFALELKADGGRLSENQKATIERMRAAGCIVAVATGLDAAIEQIEAWQLVRGTVAGCSV